MSTYILMALGALVLVVILALIFFTAQAQAKKATKAEAVSDQKANEADAAAKVVQAAVDNRPDPASPALPDRLRRTDW
jgi:hypothetical protein